MTSFQEDRVQEIRAIRCAMRAIVACVMLMSAGLSPSITVAADKPNIIYIMSDDMGFSDIGCYGSEIETPNLDASGRRTAFVSPSSTTPRDAARREPV